LDYCKRHEECVLFLEQSFSEGHAQKLREGGFKVECFGENFKDDDGHPKPAVLDPEIIRYCHAKKLLLITTDKNIRATHVNEIKKTDMAIIATQSAKGSMDVWVDALIKAKPQILRKHKRHPRPWCGSISRKGELQFVTTITQSMGTRRHRPKEQGI